MATGSTDERNCRQAPTRCRQAVWEKFKRIIDACDITSPVDCPLRAFVPVPVRVAEEAQRQEV